MISVLFLILLTFGILVFQNRIILWITTIRIAFYHFITCIKISALIALHELGLL